MKKDYSLTTANSRFVAALKAGCGIKPGQRWLVKRGREYDRGQYGEGLTVTGVSVAVDQPHPGFIHHTLVDLISDTGVKVQWSPATLRTVAKPAAQ